MKNIKIFKRIFWVSYFLLMGFGFYYIFRLIMVSGDLRDSYVEKFKDKIVFSNTLFRPSVDEIPEYLGNRFDASLMALLVLFIFIMLFIFCYYFIFRCLYFFYFCNEETVAVVEPKNYMYYMAYKDINGNLYKDHSSNYQRLYHKIHKYRKGEIELFYDKRNPKNFILGNKPVYLRDEFIKPFFTNLALFLIVFALCIYFQPFLFLSVI